jgi:hypothetical protein
MDSKFKLWVAGLAAFLLGMPLAEKAMADEAEDIVFSSLSLAGAIIEAALEAS